MKFLKQLQLIIKQLNYNTLGIIAAILLILSGVITVAFLTKPDTTKVVKETNIAYIQSTKSETTVEETTLAVTLDPRLTNDLPETKLVSLLTELQDVQYQSNLLSHQSDILDAIQTIQAQPEELGYLFLPTNPASHTTEHDVNQIDIPLILQKDPAWSHSHYGTDGTKELAENGCAIVTIAMLESYFTDETVTPDDIIDWTGNDYYVHDQGTSWNIFHDYAVRQGYEFHNFGNDFYAAMQAVQSGKPVVVSVNPGYFTNVGHILIIRGYHNGLVYVNDPNDDPAKMHSIQGIPESIFFQDARNYWSFAKKSAE